MVLIALQGDCTKGLGTCLGVLVLYKNNSKIIPKKTSMVKDATCKENFFRGKSSVGKIMQKCDVFQSR